MDCAFCTRLLTIMDEVQMYFSALGLSSILTSPAQDPAGSLHLYSYKNAMDLAPLATVDGFQKLLSLSAPLSVRSSAPSPPPALGLAIGITLSSPPLALRLRFQLNPGIWTATKIDPH